MPANRQGIVIWSIEFCISGEKQIRQSDMFKGKTMNYYSMNEILAPLYYLEFQALEELYWDRES